jgi:methylated-DNA-[protein]-cysteine S-methyltransferase
MSDFGKNVIRIVVQIPEGSVLTYAQVAARAGSPRAFRAVGAIMKSNYDPNIPCHRVIRSDGSPGEYNRGREEKIRRLQSEGVTFRADSVVDV